MKPTGERDWRAAADGAKRLPGQRRVCWPVRRQPHPGPPDRPDYLQSRFFQSSICAVVISGTYGQGIPTTISYV